MPAISPEEGAKQSRVHVRGFGGVGGGGGGGGGSVFKKKKRGWELVEHFHEADVSVSDITCGCEANVHASIPKKKKKKTGASWGKKKVTDYQATGEVGSVNIGPADP